ncbi:glycosyltransferase family 2 protein [Lacticaseibacillus paracasei]
MSTYNGEKYLDQQLKSIYDQVGVNVTVIVRDDGSTDATQTILEQYHQTRDLRWYTGSNLGPAYSFLDLLSHSGGTAYYAFSDQDDVWNPNKLAIAVNKLKECKDAQRPALYASNYQLVDQDLNPLASNHHVTTTTFNAAIVSSCCTGCTMVFNEALAKIVNQGSPKHLVMHDDWIHKVCLAMNGVVFYDPQMTLQYRQHGNNADGGVHSITSKVISLFKRNMNHDCIRSKQLQDLYKMYSSSMTAKKREQLIDVADYLSFGIWHRVKLLRSKDITTPYARLNRGFRLAILLKYF